jgi:hypothetical protein
LKRTFKKYGFQGVDLDIEERIPLEDAIHLVKRFKEDFGNEFLVSMAPVYPAMIQQQKRHPKGTIPENPATEDLDDIDDADDTDDTETDTEDQETFQREYVSVIARCKRAAPDQGSAHCQEMAQKCTHARKRNGTLRRNLSGFSYAELRSSEAGPLVDFYNVQVYCGWGNPLEENMYEAMVNAGWEPRKLVVGTVTSPSMCQGYVGPHQFGEAMSSLVVQYPHFGGVMGWEYYHPDGKHQNWASSVGEWLQYGVHLANAVLKGWSASNYRGYGLA